MDETKMVLDFYRRSMKKIHTGTHVNAYLVLRKEENILLSLRQNTGYCDHLYGLVSGHVEEGESAINGMIREAFEEANLQLKPEALKVVHVMHRKTERLNMDLFFECNTWEGNLVNREPNKCAVLEYFPLKELPANTIDYIKIALKEIGEGHFYSEIGF